MIELRRASAKAIKYACLHFHYARSVPANQYSYNIYENGEWCGVIIYSSGATNNIACPFGMVQGEVLELVRVALNGKQSHTSECVAASLKQLHKDAPQVKLIVSFADAGQKHLGIIYQATNWIYLGEKDTGHSYTIVHGQKTHVRSLFAKYGTHSTKWIKEHVDPNAEYIPHGSKHKYIFCFPRKLRREWEKKALPYPKAN